MSRPLTEQERAVLRGIAAYQTRMAGQSPAAVWVAQFAGVSATKVAVLLNGLESRGIIRRAPSRSGTTRAIEIVAEV